MRLESSFDEHPRVLKMLPERVCDFSLFRSVHQYQQAAPEIQTPRFHPSASSSIPSPSFLVAFSFSFFSSWILPVHVSQCPRFSMLLFIWRYLFVLLQSREGVLREEKMRPFACGHFQCICVCYICFFEKRLAARGKDEALCVEGFRFRV